MDIESIKVNFIDLLRIFPEEKEGFKKGKRPNLIKRNLLPNLKDKL